MNVPYYFSEEMSILIKIYDQNINLVQNIYFLKNRFITNKNVANIPFN